METAIALYEEAPIVGVGLPDVGKLISENLGPVQDAIDEMLDLVGLPPSPRPLTVDSFKDYLRTLIKKGILADLIQEGVLAYFGIDISNIFDENGDIDWTRVMFLIVQIVTGVEAYDLYIAVTEGDVYPLVKESIGAAAGSLCLVIGTQVAATTCQQAVEKVFEIAEYFSEAFEDIYEWGKQLLEDAWCWLRGCDEGPPPDGLVSITPDENVIVSILAQWYTEWTRGRLVNLAVLRADAIAILAAAEKLAKMFKAQTGKKMAVGEALAALERNGLDTLDGKIWTLVGSLDWGKSRADDRSGEGEMWVAEWEAAARVLFKPTGNESDVRPWLTRFDDPGWLSSEEVLGDRWSAYDGDKRSQIFVVAQGIAGRENGEEVVYPPWMRYVVPGEDDGWYSGPRPEYSPPTGWVYDYDYMWTRHVTKTEDGVCEGALLIPSPPGEPGLEPWPDPPCDNPLWDFQDGDAVAHVEYLPALDSIVRSPEQTRRTHEKIGDALVKAVARATDEINLAISVSKQPGSEPLTAKSFAMTRPKMPKNLAAEGIALFKGADRFRLSSGIESKFGSVSSDGSDQESGSSKGLSTGAMIAIGAGVLAAGWVGWRTYKKQPILPKMMRRSAR